MKRITLSAEDWLIDRARQTARSQHQTLNEAFREWLEQYAASGDVGAHDRLMRKLRDRVVAGRNFSRDEMNQR